MYRRSSLHLLAVIVSSIMATRLDWTMLRHEPSPVGMEEFISQRSNSSTMMTCDKCNSILREVSSSLTKDWNTQRSKDLIANLCIRYLPQIGSSKTFRCRALVNTYMTQIQTFAREGYLADLCILMAMCPTRKDSLPSPSLVSPEDNNYRGQSKNSSGVSAPLISWWTWSSEPITFIQISDIHLDMAYVQGSPNSCSYKICCKSGITGTGRAGRFGDYRCDAVKETVELLFDHIKKITPPPTFFIYVGDSSPHTNGGDTLEQKLEDNRLVTEMLIDEIGTIAPIFPTIGNHEMHPESIYNRRSGNTQAILQRLSESWPRLFSVPEDQKENIRKHAYYTSIIRPGLRILSTNSLYSYTLNLQAFRSLWDPVRKEQETFIKTTLEAARNNNQKVIHLSHIKPSHTQTYPSYARFWHRITNEFSDVIILQLFGHEHADAFLVSSSPSDRDKATGVFMAAPSITPYVFINRGTNPSYRVFKLDPDTFAPLDYDQYYVDLTKANEENRVEIKKHYTFTEEYGVPDLSPASFLTLIKRLDSSYTDYQKFERNNDVLSNQRTKCPKWNLVCRRFLTCETRGSTLLSFIRCLFTGV